MARSITVIPARANRTNLAEEIQPRKKRMAAYCRVSTDQLEQLSSYEAQVSYYTAFINNNPEYEFAGVFADEGISGTNTKKREQFNKMIEDCKAGKIDVIITKSISRFARNTLDCLNYVRMLKGLGVEVIFEDERLRRVVWRCNRKYKVKGKKGCDNKHIDDKVLYKVFVEAFNTMVKNKDYFMEKLNERVQSENVLVRYKARQFIKILEKVELIKEFDIDLFFRIVEKMTVFDGEKIIVSLLDGTEVEVVIE